MKPPSQKTGQKTGKITAGVSCVILVGGESKRIGADKAKVKFLNKTLFGRVFDVAAKIFSDIMVSAHSRGYTLSGLGLEDQKPRLIADTMAGRGPALGIASALKNARNDWVFVLACDHPMINGRLVRYLVKLRNGYDCVAPVSGGKVQTMFSLYKKTCLAPLTLSVKRGERGLTQFLKNTEALKIRYVSEKELEKLDPGLKSFVDVDTPAELKRVQSMFSGSRKRGVKKG